MKVKILIYFTLIRYILYKQFRTVCDFTFAASHKEYLLSCSVILFSNCPKPLCFLHNDSQSEIWKWRETYCFRLWKNMFFTPAWHESLIWFICNCPYNLLLLFSFACELESWRKICLIFYAAVAQAQASQMHLSLFSSPTQVSSGITWRALTFVVS